MQCFEQVERRRSVYRHHDVLVTSLCVIIPNNTFITIENKQKYIK